MTQPEISLINFFFANNNNKKVEMLSITCVWMILGSTRQVINCERERIPLLSQVASCWVTLPLAPHPQLLLGTNNWGVFSCLLGAQIQRYNNDLQLDQAEAGTYSEILSSLGSFLFSVLLLWFHYQFFLTSLNLKINSTQILDDNLHLWQFILRQRWSCKC